MGQLKAVSPLAGAHKSQGPDVSGQYSAKKEPGRIYYLPVITRFIQLISLILFVCSVPLFSEEADGWELFGKNRVEEALGIFQKALENGTQTIDDLEGLFHIYRLKCYPEGCVETALDLLSRLKHTPYAITYINRINRNRRYYDSFDSVYQRINDPSLSEGMHPLSRVSLDSFRILLKKEKSDFTAIDRIVSSSPLLSHWNFSIGPFDTDTHSRLSRIFPPEGDLSKETYSFRGKECKRGGLPFYVDKLKSDIYIDKKIDDIAYLVSAVTLDRQRTAVLSVYPPGKVRIWLNGFVVHIPEDSIGRDIINSNRRITLHKGVNVFLLKTVANRVNIRLFNEDFTPFKEFVPENNIPAPILSVGVHPISGFRFSEEIPNPIQSYPARSRAEKLARMDYFRDHSLLEDLRKSVFENEELSEKSGFTHYLRTLYYSKASGKGVDLKTRMKNSFRRELDECIGLFGEYPLLLKWKGDALIENKLFKEGKNLFDKALILSEGSTQVQLSLLSYFYQRGWEVEIEKTFEILLARSPAFNDEFYSFLKKKKRFSQAASFLKKSLDTYSISLWKYFNEIQDFSNTPEVERCASILLEAFPYRRKAVLSDLGFYYYEQGDMEKALETLGTVYAGGDHSGYSQKLLAQIAFEQGKRDEALRLWEERASLGYDVPGIYSRIRREKKEKLFVEKYDFDILDEFNERDLDIRAYPDSDFVNLLDLFAVLIHSDGTYEGIVHRAYLVVSRNGVSKLGETILPEEPDDTLFCRTISKKRDVFIPTSVKKADSKRYASMPNISPGAVVDYAYMVYGRTADGIRDVSISFEFGRSEEPTLKTIQVVAAPEGAKLYFFSNRGKQPVKKTENGFDIYTWIRDNLDGIEDESSMPPAEELVERGIIQGQRSLHSFRSSIFYDKKRFYGSGETEDLGRRILEKGNSRKEKIDLCLEWMRENLDDSGESRSVRDTVILQRGVASLKMRLLEYWLSLEGIECHEVYTNPLFFNKRYRESGVNRLQYFGKNLLRIPGKEGESPVWLDINENIKYSDPNHLDGNDINSCAIFKKDGRFVLGRVKEFENDLKNSEYRFSYGVEETGDCGVSVEGKLSGTLGARLRKILSDNPQNKKKILESLAKQVLARVHINENRFSGEGEPGAPVIHSFTGRILSFAKKENNALRFRPFHSFKLQSFLGAEDREFDYVLYSPKEERYQSEFSIPEGFYFSKIPERVMISSQYGIFIADFRVKGRILRVSVSLALPPMRIPPESYPNFTGFIKEIVKYELSPLVIQRIPENAPGAVAVESFLPIKTE